MRPGLSQSQISNRKSQIESRPGKNCCFDILTGEGVFEEALNILAIISSINVADGELVNFEGEFCFPCRSIDVPAVEFPQILLAATAF